MHLEHVHVVVDTLREVELRDEPLHRPEPTVRHGTHPVRNLIAEYLHPSNCAHMHTERLSMG